MLSTQIEKHPFIWGIKAMFLGYIIELHIIHTIYNKQPRNKAVGTDTEQ